MSASRAVVLLSALSLLGCPSVPTSSLHIEGPSELAVGEEGTFVVSASTDGFVGSGLVSLTATGGTFIDGSELALDAFGTARAHFSCDGTCADDVELEAVWKQARAVAMVRIRPAMPDAGRADGGEVDWVVVPIPNEPTHQLAVAFEQQGFVSRAHRITELDGGAMLHEWMGVLVDGGWISDPDPALAYSIPLNWLVTTAPVGTLPVRSYQAPVVSFDGMLVGAGFGFREPGSFKSAFVWKRLSERLGPVAPDADRHSPTLVDLDAGFWSIDLELGSDGPVACLGGRFAGSILATPTDAGFQFRPFGPGSCRDLAPGATHALAVNADTFDAHELSADGGSPIVWSGTWGECLIWTSSPLSFACTASSPNAVYRTGPGLQDDPVTVGTTTEGWRVLTVVDDVDPIALFALRSETVASPIEGLRWERSDVYVQRASWPTARLLVRNVNTAQVHAGLWAPRLLRLAILDPSSSSLLYADFPVPAQ